MQRPFADLGAALNFHFVIAKERSDCGNPDVVSTLENRIATLRSQ